MFALTSQERRVVLFIFTMATLGISANLFLKLGCKDRSMPDICEEMARLDLNSADKQALMGIKGIGDKLAQRIMEQREEQPFIRVEDLKKVKGMTAYRYERIKEQFSVKQAR